MDESFYSRQIALISNDVWFIYERGLFPYLETEIYYFNRKFSQLRYLSLKEKCDVLLKGLQLFHSMGGLHYISLLSLLVKELPKINEPFELENLSFIYDNVLGFGGNEISVDVLQKYFNNEQKFIILQANL